MKEMENEAELAITIGEHDVVVCDFFTTWCGPCKMLSPVLQEIAEAMKTKYGESIEFCKVDCDKMASTADDLEIESVPAVVFYVRGKPDKEIIIGTRGKEPYFAKIDKIMSDVDGYVATMQVLGSKAAVKKNTPKKASKAK